MSQYRTGRNLQEVRMQTWPAGRAAQLKLVVSRLEETINESLGQAVQQTDSREVSNQVPFVLSSSFVARTGLRQAQVFWEAPPGLGGHPFRQLLFYEVQHAATPSFANPIAITTPQKNLVVAGLAAGSLRSFRVRIVNTVGIAGPWSITRTVRLARTRIEVNSIGNTTSTTGVDVRLTKALGEFQTVFEITYFPFGGAISVNLHASLATPHHDLNVKIGSTIVETRYGGPAYVQCRFLIGIQNNIGEFVFSEMGQDRFILSAKPGFLDKNDLSAKTPCAYGTFMSKFTRLANTNTIKIKLQVAKMTGSEWRGRRRERASHVSDPLFSIRNSVIIETLEN